MGWKKHIQEEHTELWWNLRGKMFRNRKEVDYHTKKKKLLLLHLVDNKRKLDCIGPVDNRPSTNKLHHIVQKITPDTWHLTPDIWHVICDTWWGGEHSLKISAP